MTVGSADLMKAVLEIWDERGLNAAFTDLWADSDDTAVFPVVHESEAQPGQPFPYCILIQDKPETQQRMVRSHNSSHELRQVPVEFHIYASTVEGDTRSAKEIAYDLAMQVIDAFGGGPDEPYAHLELDTGYHVQTQLVNEYGVREGDNEYQWVISYKVLVDVPVRSTF